MRRDNHAERRERPEGPPVSPKRAAHDAERAAGIQRYGVDWYLNERGVLNILRSAGLDVQRHEGLVLTLTGHVLAKVRAAVREEVDRLNGL